MVAVPLSILCGADEVSALIGALSAIAATWLCVPLLILACQGRLPLTGAPGQPVLATAIGALVRIVFMAMTLFATAFLHKSVLVAGSFFLFLFPVFRTNEILFVRRFAFDSAANATSFSTVASVEEEENEGVQKSEEAVNFETSAVEEDAKDPLSTGKSPVRESQP